MKLLNSLTNMKKKSDLSDTQQALIQRKQSTLTRINNSFERPSQPLYQGQSHILVGVSLGLEKPATVAVVDAIANKVLAYRSIKQLLWRQLRTAKSPETTTAVPISRTPQSTKKLLSHTNLEHLS